MSIAIKYAVGYGHGKTADEKTLDVDFEDLGLADDADDEKIRDALWDAVVDDIRQNASMDDVLDDVDSVLLEVHEAMAMQHSREEARKEKFDPLASLRRAIAGAGKMEPGRYIIEMQGDGTAKVTPDDSPPKPRKVLKRVPAKRRAR